MRAQENQVGFAGRNQKRKFRDHGKKDQYKYSEPHLVNSTSDGSLNISSQNQVIIKNLQKIKNETSVCFNEVEEQSDEGNDKQFEYEKKAKVNSKPLNIDDQFSKQDFECNDQYLAIRGQQRNFDNVGQQPDMQFINGAHASNDHLQILSTLRMMQLPDSQHYEMKIDDSQTQNQEDVSIAHGSKNGQRDDKQMVILEQEKINQVDVLKGQQTQSVGRIQSMQSSYSSERLNTSSHRGTPSPNRQGIKNRDIQKDMLGKVDLDEKKELFRTSLKSQKNQQVSSNCLIGSYDKSTTIQRVPQHVKNKSSRMNIINEKQRQLNRIQKMRDATGEYLKSQIDSFEEKNAKTEDIIRRYSQMKELEKYKKSLVQMSNSNLESIDLSQLRAQKGKNQLEQVKELIENVHVKKHQKQKKKNQDIQRPDQMKSRNDKANQEMRDVLLRNGNTQDGLLSAHDLQNSNDIMSYEMRKKLELTAINSPNPIVCDETKTLQAANLSLAAKSMLLERNATLNDNFSSHVNALTDRNKTLKHEENDIVLSQFNKEQFRQRSGGSYHTPIKRCDNNQGLRESFKNSTTKQNEKSLAQSPNQLQPSRISSTLQQHSIEHEQREQLLFQAATIMKLHDNCLKRINNQNEINGQRMSFKKSGAVVSTTSRDFQMQSAQDNS